MEKSEIERLQAENDRLKAMIRHAVAARTGVYFICGDGGTKDDLGLPEIILVCPAYGYGADGFAIYKKASEYSAPSY